MHRKGFTLTEVSIMLLLVGIVVFIFANMSAKTARFTREEYKRLDLIKVRDSIFGYAASYKRLPLNSSDELIILGTVPRNRYNEYVNIHTDFSMNDDICNEFKIRSKYIVSAGGLSKEEEVAFILYDNNNPLYVESTSTGFTHTINPAAVTDRGINPVNILAVTYAELFNAAGCERPLIVPDEMPSLRMPSAAGSADDVKMQFTTSTGQESWWCVEIEERLLGYSSSANSTYAIGYNPLQPVIEETSIRCAEGTVSPGSNSIKYGNVFNLGVVVDQHLKAGVYRFTAYISDEYNGDWEAFKKHITHKNTYFLVVHER